MRLLFLAGLGASGCGSNAPPPSDTGEGWSGPGAFRFAPRSAPQPFDVFYYAPRAASASAPVVIALHGSGRDGRSTRDRWIPKADQYGVVVVAPQFDEEGFPGGSGYNLGGIFEDGNNPGSETPRPRGAWAFSMIEPLFDEVRRRADLETSVYQVVGHSAGAQFAHRLVLFVPNARYERVIAANAGWYTVPAQGIDFPYGLGNSPVDEDELRYFGRELSVLIGAEDNDPNSPGLRRNPQANAQGPHRYDRAYHFMAESRRLAAAAQVELSWRLQEVPAVGHDARLMILRAADLLFAPE